MRAGRRPAQPVTISRDANSLVSTNGTFVFAEGTLHGSQHHASAWSNSWLPRNFLRRLDVTTLQLFVAVYEEGTLTCASRRERIAVSAASKRLARADHPLAGHHRISFADTLDSDHVGLHSASSISMRAHAAARQAGRPLRLRIRVPSFDAVCRMVQAGMGVGRE